MVRTVDCIQSVSTSIVGLRRGWFANPGSMVANLGAREWIHILSLITGNSPLYYRAFLYIMVYPIGELCHPSLRFRLIRNYSPLTHEGLADRWVELLVLWALTRQVWKEALKGARQTWSTELFLWEQILQRGRRGEVWERGSEKG